MGAEFDFTEVCLENSSDCNDLLDVCSSKTDFMFCFFLQMENQGMVVHTTSEEFL